MSGVIPPGQAWSLDSPAVRVPVERFDPVVLLYKIRLTSDDGDKVYHRLLHLLCQKFQNNSIIPIVTEVQKLLSVSENEASSKYMMDIVWEVNLNVVVVVPTSWMFGFNFRQVNPKPDFMSGDVQVFII